MYTILHRTQQYCRWNASHGVSSDCFKFFFLTPLSQLDGSLRLFPICLTRKTCSNPLQRPTYLYTGPAQHGAHPATTSYTSYNPLRICLYQIRAPGRRKKLTPRANCSRRVDYYTVLVIILAFCWNFGAVRTQCCCSTAGILYYI